MSSTYEPRLARLAAMIADPARSRMLAYLLDGHYASAGELADAAGVVASTASGHLAKLQSAGLVIAEQRGRHRYFKLADADVAHALEALALVAERGSHERRWQSPARTHLRFARCCYGHLAGMLGVRLLDSLLRNRRLVADGEDYRLTAAGEAWLTAIGLATPKQHASQRLAYNCLDWSERRDHLAGALAVRLLDHFLAQRWLVSNARRGASIGTAASNRSLALTPAGTAALLPHLDA